MRFAVGQAFESAVSGRQAVVTETRHDGHAGHLRFLDNGQTQWVLWAQFLHEGEWLPNHRTLPQSQLGDKTIKWRRKSRLASNSIRKCRSELSLRA